VDCPLTCEYLQKARKRDKAVAIEPAQVPDQDIQVSEKFVDEHEPLVVYLGSALAKTAFETPGAVDFDVREALDSLIRAYRTLASGVLYESLPPNPLAAYIHRSMQAAITEFARQEQERFGMTRTRDADVLRLLVFLRRIELYRNNGRRRGRAFLDALREFYSAKPGSVPPPSSSSLILP